MSKGNGRSPKMPKPPKGVPAVKPVVAVPMERYVNATVVQRLVAIAQRGWPFFVLPYMTTDRARNLFIEHLLKSEYTHLIMLDSDMAHPPDIVEKLVRWLYRDPDLEIISALYFRRGAPFDPMAYSLDSEGRLVTIAEWPEGLIQVAAMGTGAICLSRKIFDGWEAPWFYYGYLKGGTAQSSEDIMFCKECAKRGIKMWVDTSTVVPHIIDLEITEQQFRAWVQAHPESAQQREQRRVEAHIPGPLLAGDTGEGFDGRGIPEPEPGAAGHRPQVVQA